MEDHLKSFPGLSRCYKNKPVDTVDDPTANIANGDEDSSKTVVSSKPQQAAEEKQLAASTSITVGTLAQENGLEIQEKLTKDSVAQPVITEAKRQDGAVPVKIISTVEPTLGLAAKTIKPDPPKAIASENAVE